MDKQELTQLLQQVASGDVTCTIDISNCSV